MIPVQPKVYYIWNPFLVFDNSLVFFSSNFSLKVEKVTDHAHQAMEFAVLVSNKYFCKNFYLSHFCLIVLCEMNIKKSRMFSVKKGCGSSSSENSTYLDSSQSSKTDLSQCTYTICPKPNVCRIRFDFAVSWHFSLESNNNWTQLNIST